MAYKDIPLSGDAKNQSQGDLKQNFLQIAAFTTKDHETFGTGADLGKHKKITFTQQGAAQTTAIDEMALYTLNNGTEPNLYLRKENDGTVFNMTPQTIGHAVKGYEILPSGLKFNWGEVVIPVNAIGTAELFADAFAVACYTVNVTFTTLTTGDPRDNIVGALNIAQNGFTASRPKTEYIGTAVTINYLAIGI